MKRKGGEAWLPKAPTHPANPSLGKHLPQVVQEALSKLRRPDDHAVAINRPIGFGPLKLQLDGIDPNPGARPNRCGLKPSVSCSASSLNSNPMSPCAISYSSCTGLPLRATGMNDFDRVERLPQHAASVILTISLNVFQHPVQ